MRFMVLVTLVGATVALSACRKRAADDGAGDLSGVSGTGIVVSADQPVTGNPDLNVATDKDGGGKVTIGKKPSPTGDNLEHLPVWLHLLGDQSIAEDQPFIKDAMGYDEDSDVIVYTLVSPATTCGSGWSPAFALNATTGRITGTPTNAAVGVCTVKITATANARVIDQEFDITVVNVNDLPTWTTLIGDFTVNEDVALAKTAMAVDVDTGATVVYGFDLANMTCDDGNWSPALAINATTGAITGRPRNANVGTCTMKITATSGGDTINETLTVTVANVNDLPVWAPSMADFTASEDGSIAGNFAIATDADAGATINYSLDLGTMNCDDGAWSPNVSINSASGELSGTPTNSDVGTCTLRIAATSGSDTIYDMVTVTIVNDSDPPTWDSTIGDKNVDEDSGFSGATAAATDPDVGDTVTYALDLANMNCDNGSWSPQIAVNATTGVISGTPTNSDVGTCSVRVRAASGGDNIFQSFNVTIANVNDAPTWNQNIGNFNLAEDSSINKTAQASDVDVGSTIVYSLVLGSMTCDNGAWSPNISIDSSTGVLTGTPTNADAVSGSCTIRVRATSGADAVDELFTVTVVNTDDLPTWTTTISDKNLAQAQPVVGTVAATDIDPGATIAYSLDLANMTCDNGFFSPAVTVNASTGVVSGTPSGGDVGTCTITIRATSAGNYISQTFNVNVKQVSIQMAGRTAILGGVCTPYTFTLVDLAGNVMNATVNTTVTITANNTTGFFYPTAACTGAITSQVISAGQSTTSAYFLSATAPEDTTLIGRTPIYEAGTLGVAVGAAPSALNIVGPNDIETNSCHKYRINRVDTYGNKMPATGAVTVNLSDSGNGVFHANNTCGAIITSTTIPANQSGVDVYFTDGSVQATTLTAVDNATSLTADTLLVNVTAAASWWNGAWTRRIRIDINNLDQPNTFTGQPVLIKLNASRIDYSDIDNSGDDIRFVNATDMIELPYDIDVWSFGGTSYVWVKVDTIPASSADGFIYMYYGNVAAPVGANPAAVWTAYWGVWHLQGLPGDTAPQYIDSSAAARHGTAVNAIDTFNGVIGNGVDVRQNDDVVDINVDMSPVIGTTSTMSVWMRTTQVGNNTAYMAPGITGVERLGDGNDIFFGWIDATGRIGVTAGDGAAAKSNFVVNDNVWRHVSITRNHVTGLVEFYVNGVLNGTGVSSTGAKTTAFDSFGIIGDTGGSPEDFNGYLDEIRIFSTVQSAAKLKADYKYMVDTHLDYNAPETH